VGYKMPFFTMAALLFAQTVGFILFARSEAHVLDSVEDREEHGDVGYRYALISYNQITPPSLSLLA
jgi:hypothetical protein